MSQNLTSITVATPGQLGLQKQEAGPLLDIKYTDLNRNCVIDDSGRPAARMGFTQTTVSPIAGTPDIKVIFEYLDDENNSEIISAAGNKLYSGTTTLTNKTGTITITNNNWQFANIAGNVVGFQANHEPVIYKGSGNFTLLQQEIDTWEPNTSYTENDVVRDVDDTNTTIYFVADNTGTSGPSGSPEGYGSPQQPTWNTTIGGSTVDNDITWTTRKFPNGNAVLSAHGRIWVYDEDATVVYYSDDLLPYKFNGGNAGFIDLEGIWTKGEDVGVALAEFNKRLIILCDDTLIIYNSADVIANLALEDLIGGVGCIARDSVQNIGSDLLWLDQTGVRSLGRTVLQDVLPLSEKTAHIRDYIRTLYDITDSDTLTEIRSVYDNERGAYLLSFPSSDTVLWLDLRLPIDERRLRAATWNQITPTSLCVTRRGRLFLGKEGYIGRYTGYTDNGESYTMSFRTAWSDWGDDITGSYNIANSIKILKNIKIVFVGGSGYDVEIVWFFDYSTTKNSATVSLGIIGDVTEWGISEWGIGEWGGGSTVVLNEAITGLVGEGKIVKLGFDVDINGTPLALQQFNIHTKIGRFKL